MKEYPKKWTNADFEGMSWHDNRVRGVRFRNPREGYDSDLIFDIDYILDWIKGGDFFQFVVAPATLTFHSAHKMHIDLVVNFKQDLDINRIDREELTTEGEKKVGYRRWLFQIHFHDQKNPIMLEATGFTQETLATPCISRHQCIEEDHNEVEPTDAAAANLGQ